MKKFGTLALTLTLAGTMALPALAADETPVLISANGYATPITLNGEAVDTAGIPAAVDTLIPLRLIAEADHGSVYWDAEGNESWFTFGDDRITVSFADNSVTLNDEAVENMTATVVNGVTFLPLQIINRLGEGYSAMVNEDGAAGITITTPNNDPMVKAAYDIMEQSGIAFGMRMDADALTETYQIPADQFEQVFGFFPMITNPDTLILGKLKDGADVDAVKQALEAYRQQQEDTFSWYLSQNLPKVQDARLVVEDHYVLFLIGENADAGEAAFHAFVEAQTSQAD